jgi:hypothetical protein
MRLLILARVLNRKWGSICDWRSFSSASMTLFSTSSRLIFSSEMMESEMKM